MKREYGPSILRQDGLSPILFLPYWVFDHIKARGNTHYCARCLGYAGCRLTKRGIPKNTLELRCKLTLPDGTFMRMRDAVADPKLAEHIYDLPDHPRRSPDIDGDAAYDRWLRNCAFFTDSAAFRRLAKRRKRAIFQCNPMRYHSDLPKGHRDAHDSAIVGRINEFKNVSEWLKAVQPGFGYCIIIQY